MNPTHKCFDLTSKLLRDSFILCLFSDDVLVRASIAMIKHHEQKQIVEESCFIFLGHSDHNPHCRSKGRISREESGGRNRSTDH